MQDELNSQDMEGYQDILGMGYIEIDGDHSYAGVKRDFELYSPLVKSGGVIGMHDIVDSPRHRRKKCDVYRFWDEIKNDYEIEEIIHDGNWAGIGVIRIK